MWVLSCTSLGTNVQKKASETWDRHSSAQAKIVFKKLYKTYERQKPNHETETQKKPPAKQNLSK